MHGFENVKVITATIFLIYHIFGYQNINFLKHNNIAQFCMIYTNLIIFVRIYLDTIINEEIMMNIIDHAYLNIMGYRNFAISHIIVVLEYYTKPNVLFYMPYIGFILAHLEYELND